jgi:hypothetical protein
MTVFANDLSYRRAFIAHLSTLSIEALAIQWHTICAIASSAPTVNPQGLECAAAVDKVGEYLFGRDAWRAAIKEGDAS